ncbi:hypothetical protein V8C40DRAFT_262675 [Trichoderma camerunense]
MILSSETGSEKSTQIPQLLVHDEYEGRFQIACTQPRRLAANEPATRVADEMRVVLDEQVGYQIRDDNIISQDKQKKTRLAYMTEDVLLRRLSMDKNLSAYACVVIGEAHERTVDLDLVTGTTLSLGSQLVLGLKNIIRFVPNFELNSSPNNIILTNQPRYTSLSLPPQRLQRTKLQLKQTAKMSENDNAQSESQIARYMLVVQSSNIYYDQDDFEIAVQQTIRQRDTTIIFWYEGYAILGFETIADYEATEEDLQDHRACGCVVRISRQEKFALEFIQAAARTAAAAAAAAASAPAAPAPAPIALTTTSAASTAITTTSVTEETNYGWFHWPGCVKDRSDGGSDCGSDGGSECNCYWGAESLPDLPEIEYLD